MNLDPLNPANPGPEEPEHSEDHDLANAPTPDLVMGLRYSLPSMLAEIRLERISGSFAMEKLDQKEIGKMFKPKKRNRAKPTE